MDLHAAACRHPVTLDVEIKPAIGADGVLTAIMCDIFVLVSHMLKIQKEHATCT